MDQLAQADGPNIPSKEQDQIIAQQVPQQLPQIQPMLVQGQPHPTVQILTAPAKLAKQLGIMHTELVSKVNETELKEKFEGKCFDNFDENAVAVRFMGVKLIEPAYPKGDERREPYKKIVNDLGEQYGLPPDTVKNMLNGALADEFHQVCFDFKFTKGAPGNFYFGKFMAANIGGKIDMIMLFYRMHFQLSQHRITEEHKHKFLWFTVGTSYTTRLEHQHMSEQQIEEFKNYFRLKMYHQLGDQMRAFELEDAAEPVAVQWAPFQGAQKAATQPGAPFQAAGALKALPAAPFQAAGALKTSDASTGSALSAQAKAGLKACVAGVTELACWEGLGRVLRAAAGAVGAKTSMYDR